MVLNQQSFTISGHAHCIGQTRQKKIRPDANYILFEANRDRLVLIFLPAYSPELNPAENLWHYFRSHFWSNRAYADYDDLRVAAVDG